MNEVQAAQAALVFIDRVGLQGSESDAFQAVKAWLRGKLRPQEVEAVEEPAAPEKPGATPVKA